MNSSLRSNAFDLYRTLAVMAVVMGHFVGFYFESITPWLRCLLILPINYGVPLFFIISGYLLAASMHRLQTTLPYVSRMDQILRFYGLRIRRIYPAYLFWLLVLWGLSPTDGYDLISHFLNLHNLFSEYNRSINPVFWSLAVEFQWYLLAPIIFWGVIRPEKLSASLFFLGLVFLSVTVRNSTVFSFLAGNLPLDELWRKGNEQVCVELYSFALGVGVWRFRKSDVALSNIWVFGMWMGLLGVAGYTYVYFFHREWLPFSHAFNLYLVMNLKYLSQLFLALLVYHYRHIMLSGWLHRWVLFISMVSYSLYIVHYPILEWMTSMGWGVGVTAVLYLLMSVAMAYLSYLWIESPFVRKKDGDYPLVGVARR